MPRRKTHEEFVKEATQNGLKNIEFLGKYVNKETKIRVRCTNPDCKYEWDAYPPTLLKGHGCPKCRKKEIGLSQRKTHEAFMKEFKEKGNSNVEVIGKYVTSKTKIKVRCKKDASHEWEATPSKLLNGEGCPFCRGLKINKSNSFVAKYPELMIYLKNKKDGKNLSPQSNKIIKLICPNCGTEKESSLNALVNKGFCCQICDDGISFPNKFMRQILLSINIPFIPEWKEPWENKYYYDIKININGIKLLIELDGEQHYKEAGWGNKPNLENIQKRDAEKNKLANENGYKLIRIDCKKSDYKYIFNNIKNSELWDMFDFSLVDFKDCAIKAQKSLLIEVCEFYKKHKNMWNTEIGKFFQISGSTVARYIKKGTELGICEERVMNYNKYMSKKVYVYKNKKIVKVYDSICQMGKEIKKDFGVKLGRSTVTKAMKTGEILFRDDYIISPKKLKEEDFV